MPLGINTIDETNDSDTIYEQDICKSLCDNTIVNDVNKLFIKKSTLDISSSIINSTTTSSTFTADDKAWNDANWYTPGLMPNNDHFSAIDSKRRFWTPANLKVTDTTMGGNIAINARPQFTRYSDIRVPGRIESRYNTDSTPIDVEVNKIKGNYGMGRYYSEAIDDNAQVIYLRFGVPQYSSLTGFFASSFNYELATLARTGAGPSALYNMSKAVSIISYISAFPLLATAMITGNLVKKYFRRPTSKFYNVKPTPHLYWAAVNQLLNNLIVNLGLVPKTLMATTGVTTSQDGGYILDPKLLDQLKSLTGETGYDSEDGFDVFKIASKAHILTNEMYEKDWKYFNGDSSNEEFDSLVKTFLENVDSGHSSIFVSRGSDVPVNQSLYDFIKTNVVATATAAFNYYYLQDNNKSAWSAWNPVTSASSDIPLNTAITGANNGDIASVNESSFLKYFDASWKGGADFAVFKVDSTGSAKESFSNSVGESDLAGKFNSIANVGREANVSFAGGNVAGDLATQAISTVGSAIKDTVFGAAEGITGGVSNAILGLTGAGYIDMPKVWQNSSASLPTASYTISLVSPYGNVMSRIQNIYLPLCMLLAGALPRSTGRQSYTSPFLLQLFDRGRCQIQLGVIDNLSITRGTTNLPFNKSGEVLGIDVSFSIADLTSIMHMPLSSGDLLNTAAIKPLENFVYGGNKTAIDEDTVLYDYLAVLAGQSLYDQIYTIPSAKLKFAKEIRSYGAMNSAAYWASFVNYGISSNAITNFLSFGFKPIKDL